MAGLRNCGPLAIVILYWTSLLRPRGGAISGVVAMTVRCESGGPCKAVAVRLGLAGRSGADAGARWLAGSGRLAAGEWSMVPVWLAVGAGCLARVGAFKKWVQHVG